MLLLSLLLKKKIELLKKLGADKVVISTDPEQMKAARGTIEFLINTVSNDTDIEQYIACVERGGKFVQVGMPAKDDTMKINVNSFVGTEVELVGGVVGPRKNINQMVDFCHKNDVYPIVEEFPFEELPKAFDKLENGRPFFRCVVNVKDFAEKNGLRK
jgi:uncharacterized zinc-type alcohol dehydrogenase-like protein